MATIHRWMWNFHQSTWDQNILYANRCSEDEQLLLRQFLWKIKNMNMAGSWSLKFTFCFMETTHELLHLDKRSLVQWKIMTYLKVLFESLFSLMELLNVAMVESSNFWGGCKTCTSQCGTTKFCMLTDLQRWTCVTKSTFVKKWEY
jgi:hypothetical protein